MAALLRVIVSPANEAEYRVVLPVGPVRVRTF
jgi:hypothetical protein